MLYSDEYAWNNGYFECVWSVGVKNENNCKHCADNAAHEREYTWNLLHLSLIKEWTIR